MHGASLRMLPPGQRHERPHAERQEPVEEREMLSIYVVSS